MIIDRGYAKCKKCGKVKRYTRDRFPVKAYDLEENLTGVICWKCTRYVPKWKNKMGNSFVETLEPSKELKSLMKTRRNV